MQALVAVGSQERLLLLRKLAEARAATRVRAQREKAEATLLVEMTPQETAEAKAAVKMVLPTTRVKAQRDRKKGRDPRTRGPAMMMPKATRYAVRRKATMPNSQCQKDS